MHRAELTLSLAAVEHNVEALLKLLGGGALWAVVKANAYGHGAIATARAALEAGAGALCVATAGEGMALRRSLPGARIIVLGPVTHDEVAHARHGSLECVAHDEASLALLEHQVRIHLKMNTGMNRWGEAGRPKRVPEGTVGVMGHFATAYADPHSTALEAARFADWSSGLADVTRHLANSAATVQFPDTHLDAARCGTAVLGLSPLPKQRPQSFGLRPALRWTSYLAQSRTLSAGEGVGYGSLFRAGARMRMGVVPVGYADGFSKRLTGSHVLVGDIPAPVIGAVSMDAIAVKLDRDVPSGTTVTIVGDGLTFEDHADAAGITNQELCTGLSADPRRIRRRFTR
ncbi:alanine racemase [Streptomyces sp. NPDC059994]|uniref:alanine racemase n=1 Tax=Streptomyces sp. NPDC059994 TaxID=3347029 RepID=UPI0036A742B3